jgi:hypothetical protein
VSTDRPRGVTGERVSTVLGNREASVDAGPSPGPRPASNPDPGGRGAGLLRLAPRGTQGKRRRPRAGGRAVDTRAIPPPRRRRCRRLRPVDLRQGRPGNDSLGGALP